MPDQAKGRVIVTATIENLADIYDARRGRIAASAVRRVEVPDAVVDPDVIGLLMPLRLVEELGLAPAPNRWVSERFAGDWPIGFPRPIPYWPVQLTIQGRDCVMDVGAIADDQPVVIGLVALGSMDWVVDVEGGKLIGNPEHGGEEMYDIFSSSMGTTTARLERP